MHIHVLTRSSDQHDPIFTDDRCTCQHNRVPNPVPRKSMAALRKFASFPSHDGFAENCAQVVRRGDGSSRATGLGTSIDRGAHPSRKEEHLARTRRESRAIRDARKFELLRRSEPKDKTALRDLCMSLKIPLSGHETKLQLTKKIKEMQGEREPSRQAILNFGRHQGRTFEWVWSRQTASWQCRQLWTRVFPRLHNCESLPYTCSSPWRHLRELRIHRAERCTAFG